MESLHYNGIDENQQIAVDCRSIINNHSYPLSSLNTTYRQNSVIQSYYYPMVVSCKHIIMSMIYYRLSTYCLEYVQVELDKKVYALLHAEIKDEIVYVPFLQTLEKILKSDLW